MKTIVSSCFSSGDNFLKSNYLGLISYQKGLDIQALAHAEALKNSKNKFVFGLEHKPVITFGTRSNLKTDLLIPQKELEIKGIDILPTDRGGLITVHAPGQLVIYPILNLREISMTPKEYICCLQKVTTQLIRNLSDVQLVSHETPGVYTEKGKIAAIGVRIHKGVTTHGIAINLSPMSHWFQMIRPCGQDLAVDHLNSTNTHEEIFKIWVQNFTEFIKPTV